MKIYLTDIKPFISLLQNSAYQILQTLEIKVLQGQNILWFSNGPWPGLKRAQGVCFLQLPHLPTEDQGTTSGQQETTWVVLLLFDWFPPSLWLLTFFIFNIFLHMQDPFYRCSHWAPRAAGSRPRSYSKVAPRLGLKVELQDRQEARGQEAVLSSSPGVSSIFQLS